jgi:hypothetical protein
MITKQKVQQTLDKLPDEFAVDDLIDRLVFIQKVEQGIEDSGQGRTISFEKARKEMKKWST